MKPTRLMVAGAIGCLGIAASALMSRQVEKASPAIPLTDQASLPIEQSQPVGWAFGRLIGYPGADKPLLPQSNGMGEQALVPPTSGVRP